MLLSTGWTQGSVPAWLILWFCVMPVTLWGVAVRLSLLSLPPARATRTWWRSRKGRPTSRCGSSRARTRAGSRPTWPWRRRTGSTWSTASTWSPPRKPSSTSTAPSWTTAAGATGTTSCTPWATRPPRRSWSCRSWPPTPRSPWTCATASSCQRNRGSCQTPCPAAAAAAGWRRRPRSPAGWRGPGSPALERATRAGTPGLCSARMATGNWPRDACSPRDPQPSNSACWKSANLWWWAAFQEVWGKPLLACWCQVCPDREKQRLRCTCIQSLIMGRICLLGPNEDVHCFKE